MAAVRGEGGANLIGIADFAARTSAADAGFAGVGRYGSWTQSGWRRGGPSGSARSGITSRRRPNGPGRIISLDQPYRNWLDEREVHVPAAADPSVRLVNESGETIVTTSESNAEQIRPPLERRHGPRPGRISPPLRRRARVRPGSLPNAQPWPLS